MDLSYFRLQSASFEVRFDPSFLLYDRAGQFLSFIQQKHPVMKLVQAVPHKVACNVNENLHVALELEKLYVFAAFPSTNLESFATFSSEVLVQAIEVLKLSVLLRVGLRLIYRKTFKSLSDASDAMLKLGLIQEPTGRQFGISGRVLSPHYSFKWEGDALGSQINLRTQERKISVEPPFGEAAFERIDQDFYEFDFDVDYYTMKSVTTGQMRAVDWIQSALQVIRRDSRFFLEGSKNG